MKKIDQKIMNLMQLRYGILLFEQNVLDYDNYIEYNKLTKIEFEKLKDILEILSYIDSEYEKGIINDKFIYSNKNMNELKKEIGLYFLFITNKNTYNEAGLITSKILELKSKNKSNAPFEDYLTIFNNYINERLSNNFLSELYISNILNNLDDNYINLEFKYLNQKNKKNLISKIILQYNCNNKDRIIKLITELSKKYPILSNIELSDYQLNILIGISDANYLKILNDLNLLKLNKCDALKLLKFALDLKKYDLGLFLYENCNVNDNFKILKTLFEPTLFDDIDKLYGLLLSVIKSPKFKKIDINMLNYVKTEIMNNDFGKKQKESEFDNPDDQKIKLLRKLHVFLDEALDNDYIDLDIQEQAEDLFIEIDEMCEYNDKIVSDYNLMLNNSNNKALAINKIKFVEELMSVLIDKIPEKKHPYLIKCYDEIMNKDEVIQQQKLIKTLTNILNKNNKKIER